MKERPILFSAPMVRALLNGTKTQTRRAIKPEWWRCLDPEDEDDRAAALKQCPYGAPGEYGEPGDRLWVKETWCSAYARGCFGVMFRADGLFRQTGKRAEKGPHFDGGSPQPNPLVKWRPSIFMPRWASRITLEITEVRVQRLQDISEIDAVAEGIERADDEIGWRSYDHNEPTFARTRSLGSSRSPNSAYVTPRGSFFSLWSAINGRPWYESNPWCVINGRAQSNPWVWALTFRMVQP